MTLFRAIMNDEDKDLIHKFQENADKKKTKGEDTYWKSFEKRILSVSNLIKLIYKKI